MNFDDLPVVPAFVGERVAAAQGTKRPKVKAEEQHESSLFDAPDYGPDGGYKTLEAATELLDRELADFKALTKEGSARSHILSQRLGVLAGHGVPHFWSEEQALNILMQACEENGFAAANGYDYAQQQAQRGLDYGMQEPWHLPPKEPAPPSTDEVDALIAEMLSADQMQERPAPQYLIKGLLNLDSEAWTIGEPGCKKSFVVLDQAVHIVKGMPWRGLKVTQGPVVMIVAEGAGGMSTRVKAWQERYGRIGAGLHMLPRPVQAGDRKAWATLAAACARLGAVMVVIDTQARVTVGLKENDATDMGLYVEAVSILRQATKACVHTIHHTGRNGGDARGSSAIDGAQGTELKVVRTGPYTGLLKVEKQKDMEERPDMQLAFDRVVVGQDEDGDDITSLVLVESTAFHQAMGEETPEPWETEHGDAQVKLLKVLRDQGGTKGLTKSEARAAVVDRFYGGDPKRLAKQTWYTAWTKVLEKQSAAGEDVVVSAGGQKWMLDELAFKSLTGQDESGQ